MNNKVKIEELKKENDEITKNLQYMHFAIRPKAISIIQKNLSLIEKLGEENKNV